jgi:hypothetical protein
MGAGPPLAVAGGGGAPLPAGAAAAVARLAAPGSSPSSPAGGGDLHRDRLAGDLRGHGLDRAEVVLAQPAAGKAVGGLKPQAAAVKIKTTGRPDPGFKRGFAEVGLERLLNLVPQLFSLLHRQPPSSER